MDFKYSQPFKQSQLNHLALWCAFSHEFAGFSVKQILIILSTSLIWACSPVSEARPPIEMDRFAGLYADMLLASSTGQQSTRDSSQQTTSQAKSLLPVWNVTPEEYEATLTWYNQDVKRWGPLLEQVVQKLEERRAAQKPS